MKKSLKSIAVLVSICAVVAILMSLTNDITAPIIKENENKTANAALSEVMPNGGTFELYDISSLTLPATVTEVYSASNGGYVIKMSTSGYASGMVIMCGVSAEGVVTGAKLVSSQETPSIGGTAAEAFSSAVAGKDLTSIDSVDTVSGATKTTAAYRAAVKDALNAFIVLGGGSVDLRTEEEILLDNLDAALPAGNREFDKHFFVEEVAGIDAMYTAKNNTGYVYVIGEAFIGVNASGEIVSECTADESAAVLNAVAVISASETSDVDLTQYTGISANVDMYSGLVYQMLEIPRELYTPLFAVARMSGWCAHRLEEIQTCRRIMRPAYRPLSHHKEYVDLKNRQYVEMEEN